MFTSETVELPGGRQQIVHLAGDGPPLLWLHGGAGLESDSPVLSALQACYTVVAPLAPGFSDLADLDELRDVHELALHYDDLLAALGLDRVTVVGHSFGAMIGAELAAHVPARVERLVLLAPLGLWNDDYPVVDLFAAPFTEMAGLLYADPPDLPSGNGAEPDVEAMVALAQGLTTVAKFIWPIPDRGLRRRLHRVSAPTLVVFGERDAYVSPRYASDFVEAIPDATKHIIEGAGHMLPVERAGDVLAAICGFLRAPVLQEA